MKAFYLFLALSLSIIACNSGTADTATSTPSTKTQKQTPKMPTQAELAQSEAKNGKDPGGAVVEKTTQVPEAPVADEGVDYGSLANSACQCGAKLRGTEDSHVGQVHVDANSTVFQSEVDCFMAAKNKMTTKPISRQKLIRQLKDTCGDLPGTLVMRIMITLAR